jgi:hypothetical protein
MVPKTVGKNPQEPGATAFMDDSLHVLASCLALLAEKSPELACVVEAWPTLPDHIRKAIIALVEAAK